MLVLSAQPAVVAWCLSVILGERPASAQALCVTGIRVRVEEGVGFIKPHPVIMRGERILVQNITCCIIMVMVVSCEWPDRCKPDEITSALSVMQAR